MKNTQLLSVRLIAAIPILLFTAQTTLGGAPTKAQTRLEPIQVSEDGDHFVVGESDKKFVAFGFNYDHNMDNRLIEDYWHEQWDTVEEDFREMKSLGANVVRIHLQTEKFMKAPDEPNEVSLKQLARLVKLAEETGLYLDITGLACYLKKKVPKWYDDMNEEQRWLVQEVFWQAVAKVCKDSPSIFCYDLMNEPILPGADKKETEWLAGEFAGMNFVQRITLDLAGRPRQQVAKAWVEKLVAAIRKHDSRHMITLGVIPWVHTWPNAKPLFYSPDVSRSLDFASVHFYPEKGQVDKALKALAAYDIGKPLIVEEMFPIPCTMEELSDFIDRSRNIADGYIGFYWGERFDLLPRKDLDIPKSIIAAWLKYFHAKAPEITGVLK